MTLPSIVPTGYAGNSTDFLRTKVDRSGADRVSFGAVSVPSGTVVTTVIGLIPFNSGARLSSFYAFFAALGAGVTVDIGYVYDDNVGNTNKQTAFIAASTIAAAGGALSAVTTVDPCTWTATANGWLVVTIGGATTSSTGNVSYRLGLTYDAGGLPT
jgi:hypothetical protein